MNKIAIISFLLLGVGILSSSAVPTPGVFSGIPLAGLQQAAVVPVANTLNTIRTNPFAIINLNDILPTEDELKATAQLAAETPGGILYVAEGQLTFAQVAADVLNLFATVRNLNTSNPLKTAEEGVQLGSGANANSVGALSLPTYSLCPLKLQYALTSCFICNQDCYVAHNLWGGKCGIAPNTNGSLTCLCGTSQADADAREIVPQSETTCKVYTPLGRFMDLVLGFAFRVRSIALQCIQRADKSWDSTGCAVDCERNHGYKGGVCQYQYANTDNIVYSSQEKQLFCICTDKNGTLSTTGRDSPLPPTTPTPFYTPTTAAPTTAAPSSTDASASSTSSTSGY